MKRGWMIMLMAAAALAWNLSAQECCPAEKMAKDSAKATCPMQAACPDEAKANCPPMESGNQAKEGCCARLKMASQPVSAGVNSQAKCPFQTQTAKSVTASPRFVSLQQGGLKAVKTSTATGGACCDQTAVKAATTTGKCPFSGQEVKPAVKNTVAQAEKPAQP